MAYQVFARKYRPQNFDDVVAQEAVTTTLKNAIELDRLHHAYLFTGPRGVGKTSLARIFAKALNCQKGPIPTPCGACALCQDIASGRSFDVLEIDGASNTSVDDVRELRENIKYSPASGRYKIYIIDEVHMLSTSAFNALLKTLEEPPAHAFFILATTEPQKLPATILSRVIRFDLRRIPLTAMVKSLQGIAKQEKITVSEEALILIAREAGGSLRDSLSLFDQAVSFAGNTIDEAKVRQGLGIMSHDALFEATTLVFARDPAKVLALVQNLFESGMDLKKWTGSWLEHFRHLLVAQVGGKTEDVLKDFLPEEQERIKTQASEVAWADLDRMFQILYRAYENISRSSYPKTLLEITCLRLCHGESVQTLQEILQRIESLSTAQVKASPANISQTKSHQVAQHQAKPEAASAPTLSWSGFLGFVKNRKPQISPILENGECAAVDNGSITVSYPAGSIYYDMIQEVDRATALQALANAYFKKDIQFRWILKDKKIVITAKAPSVPKDSIVDEAVAIFHPRETKVVEKGK